MQLQKETTDVGTQHLAKSKDKYQKHWYGQGFAAGMAETLEKIVDARTPKVS